MQGKVPRCECSQVSSVFAGLWVEVDLGPHCVHGSGSACLCGSIWPDDLDLEIHFGEPHKAQSPTEAIIS